MIFIDFYKKNDLEGRLYDSLTGFPAPHVGMAVYDQYLVLPQSRPSGFYPMEVVDRMIGRSRWARFQIDPLTFDTSALVLLGTGHVVSHPIRRVGHEICAHYGLPNPFSNAVTCHGVVTMLLNYMGLPLQVSTSKELYDELRSAADLGSFGGMVEEVLPTDRRHT